MIPSCPHIYFTVLILLLFLQYSRASLGDRSPYFGNCVRKCLDQKCVDSQIFKDPSETNILNDLVQWHCNDDCRYDCMWKTVESFMERKWAVPQFDGKWPFMRVLCFQEFASVVFSFTNLYAHFKFMKRLRTQISSSYPMYYTWHVLSLVSLNGWIWSILFHTRDTPFTEFMDYASAFAIVLSYFYCLGMRVLVSSHSFFSLIFGCFCMTLLVKHVQFLNGYRIDYDYHMRTTVAIATISIIGWLFWCWFNRQKQPYVRNCAIFMILSAITGPVLELTDFPPIFWLFDAHSLWHFVTTFLHVYFYRFMIDDSTYLSKILPDKYDNMTLPERHVKRKQ